VEYEIAVELASCEGRVSWACNSTGRGNLRRVTEMCDDSYVRVLMFIMEWSSDRWRSPVFDLGCLLDVEG